MHKAEALYSSVMGPEKNTFINVFRDAWDEHLKSFPENYQAGRQLVIGSRFRPLLVSWGYLLAGQDLETENKHEVAQLSLYIELLHKATILLDDLIDEDIARNSEHAFHVEFSENEAILFAFYLFGDCINRLSVIARSGGLGDEYATLVELVSSCLKDMTVGALKEVTTAKGTLLSVPDVKRIIELETVALVRNGLLVGYKYGHGSSAQAPAVDNLGYDCGYIFQVLNDLEPFLGRASNAEHKGAINVDLSRSRKNLAVALIVEELSLAESEQLSKLSLNANPEATLLLHQWFSQHEILERALEDLSYAKKNIVRNISRTPASVECHKAFSLFVNNMLEIAFRRIDNTYHGRLSDILMI